MGKERVRILCTVGTSFCNNKKEKNGEVKALLQELRQGQDDKLLAWMKEGAQSSQEEGRIKGMALLEAEVLPQEIGDHKFPTAEIQTLVHWLKDNREKVESLHIILLPSEDDRSQLTAHALRVYFKEARHLFPMEIRCGMEDILPMGVNVDDREKFLDSVAALFEVFDAQVVEDASSERTILCMSGGYKSIAAFAVMYAQIHSIPCLYTFEGSSKAFELMHVPIGYAIGALDEEISLLKAIGAEAPDDLKVLSGLPQWVSDTRALAPMLIKSYEKGRKQFCGTGTALFGRLRDSGDEGRDLAQYLEGLLANNWAELWMGDQIPETVEHSRRHSKRLMEFASNFFRCAEPEMNSLLRLGDAKDPAGPRLLALLIAGIYLHDIGHTALSYPIDPESGRTPFPLNLFPSAVREIHHLLTGALLRRYPERFFGPKHDREPYRFLKRCVPLLSEHHRGYTALKDGKGNPSELIALVGRLVYGQEAFEETLRPLRERFEEKTGDMASPFVAADDILKAAALLRVIDGCDVQSDRVVSPEYLRARLDRTQDEAKFLGAQLAICIGTLPQQMALHFKDLKQATSGLDVEQVHVGTFVDEDKAIGKSCKAIYQEVFRTLEDLQRKYPSEEGWGRIQTEDALLFSGLSLANRVAFKWEQFLHFYKHQSVGFVLPVKGKEREVRVRLYPTDSPKAGENIPPIVKDIEKEYEKVKSVLEDKLLVVAEAASGRDGVHG